MQQTISTERLLLNKINTDDAVFIKEIVNTEGWLRFIGDRNVHSTDNAVGLIKKITSNSFIHYWIIKLKESYTSVGIVSFIKREYLDDWDIGFALLPLFQNKGYAMEAAICILKMAASFNMHKQFKATVMKENKSSIHLLNKLGFVFEKEIFENDCVLQLFTVPAKKFK